MKSKISVIVPAYNAEKYIIECLNSIENQTYQNVEIIVVDDGSTDNTYTVVEEYAKNRNNIILFHQENGGVCAARNKGIEISSGEYITFLDADDYFLTDTLQVLFDTITSRNADIVGGTVVNEDTSGSPDDVEPVIWSGEQGLINALNDHPFTYSSCGKLFKRDFLNSTRFVNGKRIHEDSFFVFCMMVKQPKVVIVNKPVYIYRYNPNSASHAEFSDKFFDILYFANEKCRIIEDQYPQLVKKSYNVLVKAHLALLHCFLRTNDKKYNKDIDASIKAVRKFGRYFVAAIRTDKRFFLIVKFGFFRIFRILYWKKYPLNK